MLRLRGVHYDPFAGVAASDDDPEGNLARLARSFDGYEHFGTDDVVCLTLNAAVRELFAPSPRVLSRFNVIGITAQLYVHLLADQKREKAEGSEQVSSGCRRFCGCALAYSASYPTVDKYVRGRTP